MEDIITYLIPKFSRKFSIPLILMQSLCRWSIASPYNELKDYKTAIYIVYNLRLKISICNDFSSKIADCETLDASAAWELLSSSKINRKEDLQNYGSSPYFSSDEENDYPSPI